MYAYAFITPTLPTTRALPRPRALRRPHDRHDCPTMASRRTFVETSALTLLSVTLLPPRARARPTSRGLPRGLAARIPAEAEYPPAWPYTNADFVRFDTAADTLFYDTPRFTTHVDAPAVVALREYYARELLPPARDLLDLCSSVESYMPSPQGRRVVGHGMNKDELARNPALTESFTQDLNRDASLPFDARSFDLVTCALSIDYMMQPLALCNAVAHVLRPGGVFAVAFGDRVFSTKAVALWMSGGDQDHIYTVASYLHYTHAFDHICAVDLSSRTLTGGLAGDPLYIVTGRRRDD